MYDTINARQGDRDELNRAVEQFIAAGGQIETLPGFVSKPLPTHSARINPNDPVPRSVKRFRQTAQRMEKLAAMIRELAVIQTSFGPVVRSAQEIRLAIRERGSHATAPEIEQIAACEGITLRDVAHS